MAGSTPVTAAFREGVGDIAPVLLGVLPFGMAAGVVTAEAGYGVLETVGHSILIFAGAAQIAAVSLLGDGAPVAVVVVTVLVINLRLLMYGASLSPHLADIPLRRRAAGAYLLTDQAYAVSIVRFRDPATADQRWAYYLGAALTLWGPWQLATIAGVVVGGSLPDSLPLAFAVPLMFLALLVPAVTDRPTVAAAVTSATIATVGADLPSNLGMLLGALVGIALGTAIALANRRVHA